MKWLKKDKNKNSNKKNISYIPLEFEDNLIKGNNEYSKVVKLEEEYIKEIKNILQITDYTNKYKLIIDAKNPEEVDYYLLETVIANSIDEALFNFKIEDEMKETEVIKFIKEFYREDFKNESIDVNYPKKEIAPFKLEFKDDYFCTDRYYGIVNAAQKCKVEITELENIIKNIKFRTVIAIDFKKISEEKIKLNLKKDLDENYKTSIIPQELRNSVPDIIDRLEEATENKQSLLLCSITIMQLGENLENVKKYNEYLNSLLNYYGIHSITLTNNQRNGLNYCLPYAKDNTDIKFLMEEEQFLNILN